MFWIHCYVCTAVSFSQDYVNLWNCSLWECVKQLSTVSDNTVLFLFNAREITRYVCKSNKRNIKAVAETYKSCCFVWWVNIKWTCHNLRLICNDTDNLSVHSCKTYYNILCKAFLYFKEVAVINKFGDNFLNVISLTRIVRNDCCKFFWKTINFVICRFVRSLFKIVCR